MYARLYLQLVYLFTKNAIYVKISEDLSRILLVLDVCSERHLDLLHNVKHFILLFLQVQCTWCHMELEMIIVHV